MRNKAVKRTRTVLMVLFAVSAFVVADFGLNFAASLVPEMNDGLGVRSMLHGLFGVFGDGGWTREGFFLAFERSVWVSVALLLANIAALFTERKAEKK